MLATALDDITYVMVIGHIIAFLTITWMQRSVLNKVLSQHDVEVDVQRRIDAHASKTAALNQKEVEVKPATEEQNDEVWQEDEDVQWSGEVGNTIGEDVEWNKVIELED
jgi:proteasome assembly chaperone (PAC2) family protein